VEQIGASARAAEQGETQQRVKRIAGLKQKPNWFHILDAMRAFATPYKSGAVEAELAIDKVEPVLERAL
jgi:hypothetical protein